MLRHLERWLPLLWLLLALLLAYVLLVHWWWTAPMRAYGQQIAELRDEELSLRMEGLQLPELEQRLAEVRAREAADPGFLAEPDRDLATAALVQRLEQEVRRAAPNPVVCEITGRTPMDVQGRDPYPRATLNVTLRCDTAALGSLLHALESGSPRLFIDNLALGSMAGFFVPGQVGDARVDVRFDLYGYLRPPPAGVPRA